LLFPYTTLFRSQQLAQTSFAQIVILTTGLAEREALRTKLIRLFADEPWPLRGIVNRLENGPPVGFPVQYRVSGPDFDELRRQAHAVAEAMRGNPHLSNVHLDWEEPSKVVRLAIDQDKARLLGVSSQDISSLLATSLQGMTVTQFREGTETIMPCSEVASRDRKSTRLNSSHVKISYVVLCFIKIIIQHTVSRTTCAPSR